MAKAKSDVRVSDAVHEPLVEAPQGPEIAGDGSGQPLPEIAESPTITKLRVLVEGAFGKPDDVIELDGDALAQALASGRLTSTPKPWPTPRA